MLHRQPKPKLDSFSKALEQLISAVRTSVKVACSAAPPSDASAYEYAVAHAHARLLLLHLAAISTAMAAENEECACIIEHFPIWPSREKRSYLADVVRQRYRKAITE